MDNLLENYHKLKKGLSLTETLHFVHKQDQLGGTQANISEVIDQIYDEDQTQLNNDLQVITEDISQWVTRQEDPPGELDKIQNEERKTVPAPFDENLRKLRNLCQQHNISSALEGKIKMTEKQILNTYCQNVESAFLNYKENGNIGRTLINMNFKKAPERVSGRNATQIQEQEEQKQFKLMYQEKNPKFVKLVQAIQKKHTIDGKPRKKKNNMTGFSFLDSSYQSQKTGRVAQSLNKNNIPDLIGLKEESSIQEIFDQSLINNDSTVEDLDIPFLKIEDSQQQILEQTSINNSKLTINKTQFESPTKIGLNFAIGNVKSFQKQQKGARDQLISKSHESNLRHMLKYSSAMISTPRNYKRVIASTQKAGDNQKYQNIDTFENISKLQFPQINLETSGSRLLAGKALFASHHSVNENPIYTNKTYFSNLTDSKEHMLKIELQKKMLLNRTNYKQRPRLHTQISKLNFQNIALESPRTNQNSKSNSPDKETQNKKSSSPLCRQRKKLQQELVEFQNVSPQKKNLDRVMMGCREYIHKFMNQTDRGLVHEIDQEIMKQKIRQQKAIEMANNFQYLSDYNAQIIKALYDERKIEIQDECDTQRKVIENFQNRKVNTQYFSMLEKSRKKNNNNRSINI
ncbi:UNKNOWN [Stylonychia lemnae]|uniref:Uncharacterized protein n=1 Tax=Stylonychia lemnae TaxID=5949 RepID=A0A077ZZR5_STYLE|nr:UNKNOWN [Stylonychia lemnae]|eukprot:CDW75380.1 UNKNOWN [Stylonychia lemnae]